MISQYKQTRQGERTRSCIIAHLEAHPDQEFSREELAEHCNLTYEQVRRQTKNLCTEGVIRSCIGTNGKRLYKLRKSFIEKIGTIAMVLLAAWAIEVEPKTKKPLQHHEIHLERNPQFS